MGEKKRGVLAFYFQSNLLLRILIGLILGAICGIVASYVLTGADGAKTLASAIGFLKPFGDLFINLLKMIMVPVIICTLIVGTSSISPAHLGKVGVKVILFYLTTSLFAIIIGLAIGAIFSPGEGMTLAQGGAAAGKEAKAPTIVEILLAIIPTNPFGAIAKGEVLPIIFFCVCFGIALAFSRDSEKEPIRKSADTVFSFFEGMSDVMFRVVHWVMQYAPIGVFALIFIVFAKNGTTAFGPLLSVTASVYIGLILQVVLVYCVFCVAFRLSPVMFLKKVRNPMVTAFVTRSSGATIPVSMEACEKMGIPRSVFGFSIPVGATINMDGTTIYLGVCAVFIANIVGAPLDFGQQLTVVITAVLASIGTAGVPGAGAIMLLMVLESVGLKVEGGSVVAIAYGMILGIDAILDMGRTSMNVVGDMAGALIVAKTEKDLDEELFNSDDKE